MPQAVPGSWFVTEAGASGLEASLSYVPRGASDRLSTCKVRDAGGLTRFREAWNMAHQVKSDHAEIL